MPNLDTRNFSSNQRNTVGYQPRGRRRRDRGRGRGRGSARGQQNRNAQNLRNFSCPFRDEAECRYELNPERCRFGHPETVTDESSLQELPYYCCIHYLVGYCWSSTEPILDSEFVGCNSGIHLALSQFGTNPEEFEQQNRPLLESFFGTSITLECSICFEKVLARNYRRNRKFGILENCSHVFCATCLTAWHRHSDQCPVCRVSSRRYVINEKFVETSSEKRLLFPSTNNRRNSFSNLNDLLYDSDLFYDDEDDDFVGDSFPFDSVRLGYPLVRYRNDDPFWDYDFDYYQNSFDRHRTVTIARPEPSTFWTARNLVKTIGLVTAGYLAWRCFKT